MKKCILPSLLLVATISHAQEHQDPQSPLQQLAQRNNGIPYSNNPVIDHSYEFYNQTLSNSDFLTTNQSRHSRFRASIVRMLPSGFYRDKISSSESKTIFYNLKHQFHQQQLSSPHLINNEISGGWYEIYSQSLPNGATIDVIYDVFADTFTIKINELEQQMPDPRHYFYHLKNLYAQQNNK